MSKAVDPTNCAPTDFPFPEDIKGASYRLFPIELENDPLVAFHGTAEKNLGSIIDQGFKFKGDLQSCSFATSSSGALTYACEGRSEDSPSGCVVAVRFGSLAGVVAEPCMIHVYKEDRMPEVIGYCIVPAAYSHI